MSQEQPPKKARVAFLHPDLGIGGAERLVIDAAVGLQEKGHEVEIFTSHRDTSHCFPEAKDGTLVVHVHGDFFPRAICGKLHLLLSGSRAFALKRWYRAPLDTLEETTVGMADLVLVNSNFTATTFRETFSSVSLTPKVLYPALDLKKCDIPATVESLKQYLSYDLLILSINRFERKKNLSLSLKMLAKLKYIVDEVTYNAIHLVYAGGYDPLVPENEEVVQELKKMAIEFGVSERVSFVLSASDDEKSALLERAFCLTYTPEFEHFGIVPVEAMYSRVPIIACNSGGPLESVIDGKTGFLCEPTSEAFSEAVKRLVTVKGLKNRMGEAGRVHVIKNFSSESFSDRLCMYVDGLMDV